MPPTSAAVVLFLVASPVLAQTVYRYVDAEGVTHYTDNPASIPRGVTVFATDGEPISEMGKPGPLPVIAARPVVEQQQQRVQAPNNDDPAIPSSSEQYWRGQFRAAKDKIRNLEDEISADRHRTEDVNGLPAAIGYQCWPPPITYVAPQRNGASITVTPNGVHGHAQFGPVGQPGYVSPFNTCIQTINPEYERAKQRIEKNRFALERAKEELHELERKASFEAVPLEWRR
jgi:hypothetical protein